MSNLGKLHELLFDSLLKLVLFREDFSYQKLKSIAEFHKSKTAGSQYNQSPYCYVLPYSHPYVRKALWSYKFRNNRKLAEFFTQLLEPKLREFKKGVDNPLLVFVPSSPESNKRRSYCSNTLLITKLSEVSDIQSIDILKKRSGVKKQSRTKTRTERLKNPKGAFVLKKSHVVRGRNIILFDDVITTGATIKEISKLFKKAGAQSVTVLSLCH